MRLSIYLHPFDVPALHAHGGLQRLRDLGFGELALAASYHDGRWLAPWHPRKRVRFLEDGTVHFQPHQHYGALLPQTSSEVRPGEPSPLAALCGEAAAVGLRVRAWTVFGHNTRLGLLHPSVVVTNAFGDRYPYALCPAQAAVAQHHVAMVRDLAAHAGVAAIEFEALGQMGIAHSSHHDKTSMPPQGLWALALSTCCCGACRALLARRGADPDAVRAAVMACVERYVTNGDAMAPASAPRTDADLDAADREWVGAVLAARRDAVAALAAAIVPATGSVARAVQVHPDPWFTGSQLAAATAAAFPAGDERVLTCYGQGPKAIATLLEQPGCKAIAASPRRLSIWPKAPEFTGDEDLAQVRALAAAHGIESIAVYHLGLLPWRTIERVAMMLAA